MNSRSLAVVFAVVSAGAQAAGAATTVWAFNASTGGNNPHIQAYDLATGNAVADFVAPHKDAQRGRANGRGIALVGTTIYYTLADTPNVYKTNTAGADLGIAFTTSLTPGINSLAWDGSSFWMAASQPTDPTKPADGRLYKYSPSGALQQVLTLQGRENNNLAPNGLEITPLGIVVNRGSVPYDVYDFNGQMMQGGFITATFRTTGIAFDGTNYIVSDITNAGAAQDGPAAGAGILAIYDAAGKFVRLVPLAGAPIAFGIVDLAVSVAPSQTVTPQFTAAGLDEAASFLPGAIAPGEIITIFGSGMGPDTLAQLRLNTAGMVDSALAGTRVLFDGVAAPVIYTKNNQLSVVVPYSVAAKASVPVVVEYAGIASAPVTLAVTPSAPGIFTMNSSGTGQGAILNEDFTVNSPSNPARKGSIVTIYATGEGQTSPAGVDGRLAAGTLPKPLLSVTVDIGGASAPTPLYAGAAPTLVAGVFQVNVTVPADAPSGSVPVFLHVGNAGSQPGVTIAIQ